MAGPDVIRGILSEKMHGKTAAELIAAGDAIKADLDAKMNRTP